MRFPDEGVVSTAFPNHISDEVFLAVVRGEDADLVCWVAKDTHVHKHCHYILRLSKVL